MQDVPLAKDFPHTDTVRPNHRHQATGNVWFPPRLCVPHTSRNGCFLSFAARKLTSISQPKQWITDQQSTFTMSWIKHEQRECFTEVASDNA